MTGPPPDSIQTQLNIRNNVREMQDSMREMDAFSQEMRSKEAALLKQKKGGTAKNAPAVRGRAPAVQGASDPQLRQPAAQLLPGVRPLWAIDKRKQKSVRAEAKVCAADCLRSLAALSRPAHCASHM